MQSMPRVITLSDTPPLVDAAASMLGSPVRLALVRYFRAHPGPQAAASDALHIPRSSLSPHVHALVAIGVLTQEPMPYTPRALVHRVNDARVAELIAAVTAYLSEQDQGAQPPYPETQTPTT